MRHLPHTGADPDGRALRRGRHRRLPGGGQKVHRPGGGRRRRRGSDERQRFDDRQRVRAERGNPLSHLRPGRAGIPLHCSAGLSVRAGRPPDGHPRQPGLRSHPHGKRRRQGDHHPAPARTVKLISHPKLGKPSATLTDEGNRNPVVLPADAG